MKQIQQLWLGGGGGSWYTLANEYTVGASKGRVEFLKIASLVETFSEIFSLTHVAIHVEILQNLEVNKLQVAGVGLGTCN